MTEIDEARSQDNAAKDNTIKKLRAQLQTAKTSLETSEAARKAGEDTRLVEVFQTLRVGDPPKLLELEGKLRAVEEKLKTTEVDLEKERKEAKRAKAALMAYITG